MRCEDYPACGHTPADPCEPQWYDEPDAFDTTKNPHAFCDHESMVCDVYDDEDDPETCEECGEPIGQCDRSCSQPIERAYELNGDLMEDQWLDGSWEE